MPASNSSSSSSPQEEGNRNKKKMMTDMDMVTMQEPPPSGFLRLLFSTPLLDQEEGTGSGKGKGQFRVPIVDFFATRAPPPPPPPPPPGPACITLDHVRNGLQRHNQNSNSSADAYNPQLLPSTSSLKSLAEDISVQAKRHEEEIDQLIRAHGEQLKRKLAEREQSQYTSLLLAAERTASKKLHDKEASLDRAVRRAGELQRELENSKREAAALEAQAAEQAQAISSLRARLRRAEAAISRYRAKGRAEGHGETEDAESGCMDPERRTHAAAAPCRECRERPASVVVLPCRHLCLCAECNRRVAPLPCPVCGRVRTGCMQVLMN